MAPKETKFHALVARNEEHVLEMGRAPQQKRHEQPVCVVGRADVAQQTEDARARDDEVLEMHTIRTPALEMQIGHDLQRRHTHNNFLFLLSLESCRRSTFMASRAVIPPSAALRDRYAGLKPSESLFATIDDGSEPPSVVEIAPRPENAAFFFLETGRLVAVIPATAPVRQKSLYAASLETLKSQLGITAPARTVESIAEVTAAAPPSGNSASDSAAQAIVVSEFDSAGPERSYKHSIGLRIDPSTAAKLSSGAFARPTFRIDGETIVMEDEASKAAPLDAFHATEPRFYLHLPDTFVYHCPDSAPVRLKMMYSSSKGALLHYLETEAHLTPARKLEVSSVAELQRAVEVKTRVEADSGSGSSSPGGGPSPGQQQFKKPSRGGRGTARLNS